ncbi:MAG TPA: type II toxin-antitoxin system RelE/ParE family toxin [Pyrinomonadaceae bacterium]|nr:type II toxin-antitoxin system RelE/ParE family toxin [Pyrinomonadaceae bacterium]
MRILWTEPAIEDLHNLYGYIAKDSEIYAASFVERIILSVEKLVNFPRLGRVVPEAELEMIRELLFQNYRIIYRLNGELIEILTVLHGNRDLSLLNPAPWDVSSE